MFIEIDKKKYEIENVKDHITIADSFVFNKNKTGKGNGEAKLYLGSDNNELRSFFGEKGFRLTCCILKNDLLKYLSDTKYEYLNPTQNYRGKKEMPALYEKRKAKIEKCLNIIYFKANEEIQIEGNRVYIKPNNNTFKLIREISLPSISYLSILKLKNKNDLPLFYFRLFSDFSQYSEFGEIDHPNIIKKEILRIYETYPKKEREIDSIIKARRGQGAYRKKLLEACPQCPITSIADERILIASHIKPWSRSNDREKVDPKNGFMFTPTVDKLFDQGFISFTNEKKLMLSPYLSDKTYKLLNLEDNMYIENLPIKGKIKYLEYHRNNIFKKEDYI